MFRNSMRLCCSSGGLTKGSLVHSSLAINFSAGDGSPLKSGQYQCAGMASYGSSFFLSAFVKSFLLVCTDRSAIPLPFGYLGLDVTCKNSHLDPKSANAAQENCSPSSDTTLSVIPCLEKIDFM